MYPGKRLALAEGVGRDLDDRLPSDVHPSCGFAVMPFLANPADYSTRPEMEQFMEELAGSKVVLLTTAFLQDDHPTIYARRCIHAPIMVIQREHLSADRLEYHFAWEDPKDICPELMERTGSISLTVPPD